MIRADYLLRRLFTSLVVIAGVLTLTFVITRILPSDPAQLIAGQRARPEQVAAIRSQLGLDRPLPEQFVRYLGGLARGDLGRSFATKRSVRQDLGIFLPATLELVLCGFALALVDWHPGRHPGGRKRAERVRPGHRGRGRPGRGGAGVRTGAAGPAGVFQPASLAAAQRPVGRRGEPGASGDLRQRLPVGGHSLDRQLGRLARRFGTPDPAGAGGGRLSACDCPAHDAQQHGRLRCISRTSPWRAPRACPNARSCCAMRLRNAILPVLTIAGLMFAYAITGTLLVELLFRWPGVGKYVADAIVTKDFPPILAVTLVSTVIFVGVTFLMDLLRVALDPRVRG